MALTFGRAALATLLAILPPLTGLTLSAGTSSGDRALRSEVRMMNGRPTIHLNGEPVSPMVYALTDVPGGRWSWEELPSHTIAQFAARGFRLFQVDLFFDHCWREDGTMDISLARKQIAGVLHARRDAAVIIRFHVTAPKWWMRRHPEEWVRYADVHPRYESSEGLPRIIEEDNGPAERVSMASAHWKSEATARLKQFLRLLAKTPEGRALAGIQVANGVYGEWHNWGFYYNEPDVSEPMNTAFAGWLRQRYGSDANLRTAWNDPTATLASARVPGLDARAATRGIFRDPATEGRAIDYYRCVHELVADNILHFARTVKESWPRPIITGTFYGYYFSTFNRQAAGGHLELQRILSSRWIDYLSGPQAYEPESLKPGEAYRSRSLIMSVRLHGKLWLDEMDAEPTIPLPRVTDHDLILRNGVAAVRRNVLFSATKGMGLWFYDFGIGGVDLDNIRYNQRGSRGTWDHSVIMGDIGAMKNLVDARLRVPYSSDADVLFVYDTGSFYSTASLRGTDPFSTVTIDHATLAAFKSGVVFDPVHLTDLPLVDLSRYKVIVFGNVWVLTAEQQRYLREHVATGGRTVVWYYAPGYSNGTTLSVEHCTALTGFALSPETTSTAPAVILTLPGDTARTYVTGKDDVRPLFAVDDPAAEVFGTYRASGHAAVARKIFHDHRAWYIAVPHTGEEPLRSILRTAGAHVYCQNGEIVYAGDGLLVIHTKTGGVHRVTLRSGKIVLFDLPAGVHTLVLDPATGDPLLPLAPEITGR
jgi:hypothetical protein